jgi:hypothetical protein
MIECQGWWQQRGLGRQEMSDLLLDFRGPILSGQGRDVVAAFTLTGKIRPDGSVEILKQYQRRHSVLYVGTYDGEGSMCGRWDIGGYQGQWSIRLLKSSTSSLDEIQDIGS